jgi:hypothetical protein
MVNKIKKGVMNHLGPDAEIHFDPVEMKLVGEIDTVFGVEVFEAQSVRMLIEGYEKAVESANERNRIFLDLVAESSDFEELIQSGEAKFRIDPTESELRIGMKIKMILSVSDGAVVQLQEEFF